MHRFRMKLRSVHDTLSRTGKRADANFHRQTGAVRRPRCLEPYPFYDQRLDGNTESFKPREGLTIDSSLPRDRVHFGPAQSGFKTPPTVMRSGKEKAGRVEYTLLCWQRLRQGATTYLVIHLGFLLPPERHRSAARRLEMIIFEKSRWDLSEPNFAETRTWRSLREADNPRAGIGSGQT